LQLFIGSVGKFEAAGVTNPRLEVFIKQYNYRTCRRHLLSQWGGEKEIFLLSVGCLVLLGTYRFEVSLNKLSSIPFYTHIGGVVQPYYWHKYFYFIVKEHEDFQGDLLEEDKMGGILAHGEIV
jgi:hypothetical protein